MTARTTVADGVDELQRALADDAGFDAWYRRSVPRVCAYLMRRGDRDMALTEDLTQQAFVAAIAQRSSFLPSLPTSQRALLVFVVLDDLAVAGAACITDAGLVDEDRRAVSAPAR